MSERLIALAREFGDVIDEGRSRVSYSFDEYGLAKLAAALSQPHASAQEAAPEGAIAVARLFHDTYEELAPVYGYETREETKVFDQHSKNGRLMVATCRRVLKAIALHAQAAPTDRESK